MINRRIGVLLGGLALLMASCAPATPVAPTVEPLPPAEQPELTPSVSVSDQDASGGTVTIAEVVAAEPGWLAIHITKNGAPGPVIGFAPVSVGANADVQVEIDLAKATGQLFAMLHIDAGYEGDYEFPGADVPVTAADQLVNVPFNATFPIVPSVTVTDQDASEGNVSIESVVAAAPGWLAIHVTQDGAPGPVIGIAPVIVGYNPEVMVEIDLSQATGQLFAMLHLDEGAAGVYEFPGADVPAFAGEAIVNVPFNATFAITASVTASDQAAVEGTVTVDRVSAAEPGWIVIHIDANGAPGPVIGFAPVAVGSHQNVAVEIDLAQATPTLYAMLHVDEGAAGVYEFPGADAPAFAGEAIVNAPFQLLEEGASAGEVVVSLVGVSFSPKEVTVPVGTTIKWLHNAAVPHTVTADDGLFDSGPLNSGGSFSYTFDEAGTFAYYCRFHGGPGGSAMAGVIIVTEPTY
jgi:plastocyanin